MKDSEKSSFASIYIYRDIYIYMVYRETKCRLACNRGKLLSGVVFRLVLLLRFAFYFLVAAHQAVVIETKTVTTHAYILIKSSFSICTYNG